ncbi:MAG: hypothetical protein R8K20_09780 [Gallionellaceae bacterium]
MAGNKARNVTKADRQTQVIFFLIPVIYLWLTFMFWDYFYKTEFLPVTISLWLVVLLLNLIVATASICFHIWVRRLHWSLLVFFVLLMLLAFAFNTVIGFASVVVI